MAFAIQTGDSPDGRWTTAEKRCALATEDESARLCLPMGRPVIRELRVRRTKGRIDLVETTVSAPTSGQRFARSGTAEERLSFVPAPAWVATLLDIAISSPVLKLDRIVRSRTGQPRALHVMFTVSSAATGAIGPRGKLRAHNR